MGVLNVTPDSFFDGGRYLDHDAAIRRGREILDEGADILDIGGESTRPGASAVPEDEELNRVLPVVEALALDGRVADGRARISIDTTTPAVARAAVSAGATIMNDVSASLAEVAAETGAAFVAMHAKGTPADMQDDPRYDDVVAEVSEYLAERAGAARAAGVAEVWIDPGIGFGKTAHHNLALLRALEQLTALGWPVVVGTSRKTFLGRIAAGGPDSPPLPPSERFEGSLATAVWSMACGAAAVRVHDVRATVHAARLVAAACGAATYRDDHDLEQGDNRL
ncbi:MAG: dihydropteroate synthase [Acidimicrobiales bacterium]|jgi:dihydropteroate synthase